MTVEAFRRAKDALARELLHPGESGAPPSPHPLDNVVGVGVGERIVAGRPTGRRAVVVLVRAKFPIGRIARADRIPPRVGRLAVDVQAVGSLRPLSAIRAEPSAASAPLGPGGSIGPSDQPRQAATLGLLANAGPIRFAVTAGHAFAGRPAGSEVVAPARPDGGRPGIDRVAVVERVLEPALDDNVVDCAALRLTGDGVRRLTPDEDAVSIGDAAVDTIVQLAGRTSGYATGRVVSIDCDVKVGPAVFRRQILAEPIGPGPLGLPGDSGAALVDRRSTRSVGLVFAAGDRVVVAQHLSDVLDALGLEHARAPQPIALGPVVARNGSDHPSAGLPVFTRLAP
jgi:hypothetical protein